MGKLVVDNRTYTMAAVLQRLHRLQAADKAQAPAVPGAPAVLLDGRRRDLVNDGTDDRITQLKQLHVTLKEGFWGAVGILYSLVNWLYGLLRRRQIWSVLTALGLLSLAFIVICPTWEPPPETAETAPMVTTSTALIPFVPLKPDKVILEPVEGMWREIHTRVSYLRGWEACLESLTSQKRQDKRHLAIQNQQGIELEREMFINSFQKYVVDCVQKQMHKIYAYSNSLLTIDQIETHAEVIGRLCNATIELMAFEGVRKHLKEDSDDKRVDKGRYNTTKFLTDTWWSCEKIQEALLLKSAMPPENVNSSFVILANVIRDGNIHLNHDERRKMAATKRQDWARDQVRSSCEKHAEDATAVHFTERFPQLEPAKTDVPTLNAMTASP